MLRRRINPTEAFAVAGPGTYVPGHSESPVLILFRGSFRLTIIDGQGTQGKSRLNSINRQFVAGIHSQEDP